MTRTKKQPATTIEKLAAQDAPATETPHDATPAPDTPPPTATDAPPSSKRGRKTKAEPAPAAAPAPAEDLVEDDGEMVTRDERDGRQRLRDQFAKARATRKNGPSAAAEREIEATLDAQAPSWREQAKAQKTAKDAEKKARLGKLKQDRAEKTALRRAALAASGKHLRPEHSNTEAPAPTAEDRNAPEADRTMVGLQDRWCKALTRAGKTEATVAGYRAALGIACDHFGEETLISDLTARKVGNYFTCDRVTKTRSGKAAARTGVEKVRRTLRLALVWAVAAAWIQEAPLPPKPAKSDAA